MSYFAVIEHGQTRRLEILELANDHDPVESAKRRNAFLVGISLSKERAEILLSREQGRVRPRG